MAISESRGLDTFGKKEKECPGKYEKTYTAPVLPRGCLKNWGVGYNNVLRKKKQAHLYRM